MENNIKITNIEGTDIFIINNTIKVLIDESLKDGDISEMETDGIDFLSMGKKTFEIFKKAVYYENERIKEKLKIKK